jgi:hypothetical protein
LEEKDKLIEGWKDKYEDLNDKININRSLVELIHEMDDTEKELNIKEKIENILKQPDSIKNLTAFVFVLHQKVKTLQEEIDNSNL